MSMDSIYLALWQRMNAVVSAYTAQGRVAEADYCMADFFALSSFFFSASKTGCPLLDCENEGKQFFAAPLQ